MFKRLILDDWLSVIPIIAFLLTFGTFLYFSWRAIRMSREKRNHMANLPLEGDGDPDTSSSAPHSKAR